MEHEPPGSFCVRYHTAVELIGKRWNGVILRALLGGPLRYAEIRDAVPALSDTLLSQRLKELEREGIVTRTVTPEPPVRVSYELTDKGAALSGVVEAIETWSHTWVPMPAS